MTNLHVCLHPLRQEDRDIFQRIKNRQYEIGSTTVEKRKRVQERSRARRKQRIEVQRRAVAGQHSDATIEP